MDGLKLDVFPLVILVNTINIVSAGDVPQMQFNVSLFHHTACMRRSSSEQEVKHQTPITWMETSNTSLKV